jgi:Amt family ammonium transporter
MAVTNIRATEKQEGTGLDLSFHGEEAYTTGEGSLLLLDAEINGVTGKKKAAEATA